MKKIVLLLVVFGFSAVVAASAEVYGSQVAYVAGTVPGVQAGVVGVLETTSPDNLVFRASQSTAQIPYARISTFEYHRELRFHIGVLPAIAVGLVKRRDRLHYFTITWKDAQDVPQTALFEVSRHAPEGLLAILRARAPKVCQSFSDRTMATCGVRQ